VALCGLFATGYCGLSQQQQVVDVKARSAAILGHVSAMLHFYRNTTAPIQSVGESNDIVYRDQAVSLVTQATQLALQSADAEAELLSTYQQREGAAGNEAFPEEQQRLQNATSKIDKRIADLKVAQSDLDRKIATARARDLPTLQAQRKELQDAMDLANAMSDAIQKTVDLTESQGRAGLGADIDSLRRSLPELSNKTPPVTPPLASLDAARSSGITSQTMALFKLVGTSYTIKSLLKDNDALHQQAQDLRTPIVNIFRNLSQRSQELSQQIIEEASGPAKNLPAAAAGQTAATAGGNAAGNATGNLQNEGFASMTKTFKALSSASVPLSQEIILLEQSRANLEAWKSAVDREYTGLLHAILLRLMVIAIALGVIFVSGNIWTRATNRYVHDARRRRQLLLMRRSVVGFLSALVLLFGFVTQFNSLATFAGFLTAGIAVGLQTILLSVAAYFFIVGRYGIKVGDRISVAGVTGDVIEVGLVRFYMMELAGSGAELNFTGRVAVFSNAVLFQAGSPLYKQLPGTEYAWHELIVKFNDGADYQRASKAILRVVETIYDVYRAAIERQHGEIQQWMHSALAGPEISSHLQFDSGAIQLWARFPVQIQNAAETDDKLTLALLDLFQSDAQIKSAVASTPTIKASVRG
jgi:small-conductance mechanosensitive channel